MKHKFILLFGIIILTCINSVLAIDTIWASHFQTLNSQGGGQDQTRNWCIALQMNGNYQLDSVFQASNSTATWAAIRNNNTNTLVGRGIDFVSSKANFTSQNLLLNTSGSGYKICVGAGVSWTGQATIGTVSPPYVSIPLDWQTAYYSDDNSSTYNEYAYYWVIANATFLDVIDSTAPNITQINFTSDGGAICSFPTNCANTTDLTPTFSLTISEVATCRMSTSDQNYDAMSNTCSGNGTSSASCTQSTELSLGSTVLYFACVDTSGNNNTAPLANNFKANITIIEDTTVPSVNQSTIIVTDAVSGGTNWQSNYNSSVRVQNRRPSTNFTLDRGGTCAVSTFAGNYSAIIADDATTLCSTTQNATAQICQLPLSKKLIDGNDFIYFGCQNKYGYQSSNYTFYGNISQDYEFIGNVTDNDNNALANATVVFMYQSNNSVLNVSTTNATGWVSGVFFNNPSTLFTIHAYMSTNVSKGGDIEIFVNTTS